MWRAMARRALLSRAVAAQELRPSIVCLRREAVMLPSTESVSRSSIFSRKSEFFQRPRFFSSNQDENYEEPSSELPVSEGNGINGGVDFRAMNEVDGNTRSEFATGDSVFDDAGENLEMYGGSFGESFDGSPDALGENLGSESMECESLGLEKDNDPEKVESLLSLLQSRGTVSGSLESDFEGMDLVLDEEFVLKVLQTPYVPGENLISFFRWVMQKPEYKLTAAVVDALVRAICTENRKMQVYVLWDLVREIGEKAKGVVSTELLNELILEFSRLGKGKAAFEVFNKFEEFGCYLNVDTYYLTIEALCKRSFYDWACLVSEKMLNAGELPDAEKVGKIISYFCKGGRAKDAHLVYMYAKDKNPIPSRSTKTLIRSLSRIEKSGGVDKGANKELDKETVSLALEMLNDFPAEDRKYAIELFSRVIKKLCWIEDVDRAKKLLNEMIESGPPPGNDVFNCIIRGLAKARDMEEAVNLKKLMQKRGLKPDVYTYSVIISGYARGGEMEEALRIFNEAKKRHSKLSPVTFHSLIRGFCKLEQFDKAVSLLGEMKQSGVSPSHDEYNKLIKSLCLDASDWQTAEKLQEQMRENGLILNGRTWALINAVKELDQETSPKISS